VVELEHDRIGLSAIDARMFLKKGDQVLHPFLDQRNLALPSRSDVTSFVRRIVLLLVLGAAGPAVVVPLPPSAPPPSKSFDWFLRLAAPAPPHEGEAYAGKQTFP